MPQNYRLKPTPLVLLLIILGAALFVRLQLFTGLVRGDDFHYAKVAYELSQGRTHFDVWSAGTARVGLYAPVALLYRLFGVSEATTVAFPLATSLGTVAVVYAVGALFASPAAGLLAAMLWAVFPLDIFLATDLLPDGPLTFFCSLGVYALFRAERGAGRARIRWGLVSALALGWALAVKPTALPTIFFVLAYLALRLLPWPGWGGRFWRWAGLVALGLGVVFVLAQYSFFPLKLAATATDLTQLLLLGQINYHASDTITTYTPLFFVFGPLLAAGLLVALARKSAGSLTLWAAFNLVFYEWGSFGLNLRHYNPLQDWADGRYLLYVLPPLMALAGIMLAAWLDERWLRWLVPVWAALVCGGALVAVGGGAAVEDGLWKASLLALVGLITSLVLSPANRPDWLGVGLVLLLGLAGLAPSEPYDGREYGDQRALTRGLTRLAEDNQGVPAGRVYIDRAGMDLLTDLAFGFEPGHNWRGVFPDPADTRLRFVSEPEGLTLGPGDVLILFDPASAAPEGAQQVAEEFYGAQLLFRAYQVAGGDG